MTDTCSFHPASPAQWFCPECGEGFCEQCVVRKNTGISDKSFKYYCPKCNVEAQWIGVANLIPPFWERLHKFFVYPLYTVPLIFILTVSAFLVITSYIPVIGWFVSIILNLVLLRYGFEILKRTAKGRLVPPKVNMDLLSEDLGPVIKYYILIILLGIILFVSLAFGPFIFFPLLIFVMLCFPAMLIMLVTSSSLRGALNPALFIPLIWRIGPAYLLMYFFLVLLYFAPAFLSQYFIGYLPHLLSVYLANAAKFYYVFVSFHLIGYVLLQYQLEIGYTVNYDDFQDVPDKQQQEKKRAAADWTDEQHVEALIQKGDLDGALSFLKKRDQSEAIDRSSLAAKYYKLLKMKEDSKSLQAAGNLYLGLLLQENKRQEGLNVYQELLQMDPAYLPDAQALFILADTFADKGQYQKAAGLYQTLIKNYPNHSKVFDSYFRIAMILNERMSKPEKARAILQGLLKRYPKHADCIKVSNYLEHNIY